MLIVHDTYRVTWSDGVIAHTLRVPKPELHPVLSVLLFNNPTRIAVEVEPRVVASTGTTVSS